ncbi:MAG TPA: electron transfer flavoprotein subunit beta/FixA family protein [Candidatus Dormibacteraeota bacterium]|nr:electron transfer flavoprotein subunit beta/FixA family protein [Candidatus Dormibacteraeota bacterium]
MKLVVCVKLVKILGDEVEFTPDGLDVDPDYLEHALNEWDACALEEALRIREHLGEAEVVAVTAGDKLSEAALRRCLAMGADRAVRVESTVLDPISTARAIAAAVEPESADLVLCGVQSSDSVQGSTGTALSEQLGLPRVAVVKKLEWGGSGPATVQRELEGGLIDVVEVDTPAVLTIQTGINQPRYATLRAIKLAEQQEIAVIAGPDIGEPAYRVRRMFAPPKGEGAQMLKGSPSEIAGQIAGIIKERLK